MDATHAITRTSLKQFPDVDANGKQCMTPVVSVLHRGDETDCKKRLDVLLKTQPSLPATQYEVVKL